MLCGTRNITVRIREASIWPAMPGGKEGVRVGLSTEESYPLSWMKEDEDVQRYLHSCEERMRFTKERNERWKKPSILPYQCYDFVQAKNPQTIIIRWDMESSFRTGGAPGKTIVGSHTDQDGQLRVDQNRQEQQKTNHGEHQPATLPPTKQGNKDDKGPHPHTVCSTCNETGHISINCSKRLQ